MEITSNLKELSQCKREIEIEIPVESVNQEWNKIIREYSSRAKIKGFRQGKAPMELVKRIYYDEIKSELINNLIPQALNNILQEKKLNPINSPVIKRISFEEGKPLSFSAFFEILPDFKLEKYKGFEVEGKKIEKIEVKKEEIEEYLKKIQEQQAELVLSKRRTVKNGDYVVTQIEGSYLENKKKLPPEKIVIIAGHPSNAPVLNENLLGMKINEEKVFQITYPKNYENKNLAGKSIEYKIKVMTIKERRLPKINDDFAKSLGEYDNLADLKKKIRETIRKEKQRAIREEMAEEILKKISDNANLEIPETLIEAELKSIIENVVSQYPNKELHEKEVEELIKKYRPQAEKNVKYYLILNKIAQQEKIDVKDDEIEEEIRILAKERNLPLSVLKREIEEKNGRETIKRNILFRKIVDFLLKEAIIKNRD